MIQQKSTDEAVMLLWDRLFGNGIEGAIPGIQRSLDGLRKGQERNNAAIGAEKERLTEYIATRESTCPLLKNREQRGASSARLIGVICGANGAVLGIIMLVLKLAGVI